MQGQASALRLARKANTINISSGQHLLHVRKLNNIK